MMRTAWIDRGLPSLGPDLARSWRQWLARHGLPDPMDIPLDTEIVCDDAARTVTVEVYRLDRDGRPCLDADGFSVRETVTVQLEARALPMPDGYR